MRSAEFKKWCQELRIKGYTLGEISLVTKRPKTTVYFHIKSIPPTSKLLSRIKAIRADSIKGKGPLKGRSLLGYKYKEFNQWTPSLVNLVAHTLFDGAIRREGVLYYNRSQALIDNFKNIMSLIYDGKPKIYNSKNGVTRIAYHNVELSVFLKNKSEQLIADILKLPVNFQREFLRAFFDDEGSVDFRLYDKKRRIKGYQHNTSVLNLISKLLKNFGVDSCVYSRFNEVVITKKENIKQFAKEINFSKGLNITGQRSNSVWKRSFEKRSILSNLLDSYQS